MNFSQADLPHIKWSLLALLLALAIGGSAVFFTRQYAETAEKSKTMAEKALSDARRKLNAARDDLQNMATYTREFSAMQRRGIIGDESRLNMIEALNSLQKRNLVLDFKYEISPQQPYKAPYALDSGSYDLKFSPMKLQLDLLHEVQFLRFYDNLTKDMPGWFILDKCVMDRSANTMARLKAECSGGWLTMKNRNAP